MPSAEITCFHCHDLIDTEITLQLVNGRLRGHADGVCACGSKFSATVEENGRVQVEFDSVCPSCQSFMPTAGANEELAARCERCGFALTRNETGDVKGFQRLA